ncbi:MAG: hypothetical protein V1743_00705 [Nanoarchaeota archaeon]
MKKDGVFKLVGLFLIILLILNFIFFIFGKVRPLLFWMIIILTAILSFVLKWANRKAKK